MTRTNITISAPSIRFFVTVDVVRCIKLLLSRKGSRYKPSGNDFCTVFNLSFTLFTTSLGFEPLSISTMPPTASCPSCVTAP